LNLSIETTGTENTAVGVHVLKENNGGDNNVGVGTDVLYSATGVSDDTCIGHFTCFNMTASEDTALGSGALTNVTTGVR
jgi:trimeric autotransporter adhesin